MRKLTKFAIALMAVGAAAAGAALYFKKFGGCKCCSEEGECGCGCDEDDSDQEEEDSSFDSREYVSIQPKNKNATDESTDNSKDEEAKEEPKEDPKEEPNEEPKEE